MTDTYDEYVSQFDWTVVSPPIAVVEALAEKTGQAIDDLPALYEYVDPDALETLVGSQSNGEGSVVRFTYRSQQVTVEGSGTITVTSDD